MTPQTIDTNKKSASQAKAKSSSQSPTPQMDIQRVNKGIEKFKGSKKNEKSRKQKKITRKNRNQTMKTTVLQNIKNSKIEEKRQEAKLRRSLEETVEFYDNNRIEECLMEYFEERENWNQVPDENQNYLAPIITLEHVRMV
ncbi:hypothetical protein L5515_015200 [Caenorhabditis briggsae]|uniref:Uncharacterized protein n=1 Tax=Caenorhabditis briggsae TaxID=6238 RepID=A0AAE9EI50_CAEBR|nr:hypothetical protein L5515_015200 [Caenorhabditis briggsae]